jgi:hypothetical protein
LKGFYVSADNNTVHIDWSTASEVDNAGFELQRADGEKGNFVPIVSYKTDPRLRGLGTSSIGKNYSYDDEVPGPGLYRYRLIDISARGEGMRMSHPEAIILIEDQTQEISWLRLPRVRPNPAREQLQIGYMLPNGLSVSLDIYSVEGRKVMAVLDGEFRSAGNHVETCALQSLKPGVYMLCLVAGNAIRTQRFVVVH